MNDFWNRFWSSMIKMSEKEMSNIDFSDLFLSCLMAVIIVQLIGLVYSRLRGKQRNVRQEILIMLLVMVMLLMYEIAVLGREPMTERILRTNLWWFGKNMDDNTANLLNVFFFVPFGVIVGLLLKNRRLGNRLVMVMCYSFLMSMSIEMAQFVSQRGYLELVDVETNTFGGVLGAVLIGVLYKGSASKVEEK